MQISAYDFWRKVLPWWMGIMLLWQFFFMIYVGKYMLGKNPYILATITVTFTLLIFWFIYRLIEKLPNSQRAKTKMLTKWGITWRIGIIIFLTISQFIKLIGLYLKEIK